MRLNLLFDNEVVLGAEFTDPLQGAVAIVYVNPSFENTIKQWLSEEQFILSHDEETGGYAGRTNGLDDIRAFEQRVLALVHEMGDGWDYKVVGDDVAKHLPGQHDQLTHASGSVGRRPEEAAGRPTIKPDYETMLRSAISKLSTDEQRKIQDIREKLKTTQTTKQQYYDEATKQYTPERQALHDKIAGAMLAEGMTQEQPTMILTGGLPGSGKSSITSQKDIRDFVKIDSDAIKAQLPEYDGWNAALLQNEADDIISRVMVQAVKERKNVLFDGTMKAQPKYNALVDRFSAFNYKVGIWFAELPMESAMDRVISRWRETGRFVDPTYVATHNGHNKETLDRIKDEVDFYEVYDSNVPFGEPAKLKERGHATAEARR